MEISGIDACTFAHVTELDGSLLELVLVLHGKRICSFLYFYFTAF